MTPLTDMLGLTKSTSKEVTKALATLERNHTPVRAEIERTQIRFNTVVSVKRGMVIVAKPVGLGDSLKTGSTVRFTVPGGDGRIVRLDVTTPNFNLTSGGIVFLCKMPTAFAEGYGRASERYNTTRFNNLVIKFANVAEGPFRILDLSSGGCKFHCVQAPHLKLFPLGKAIPQGLISLGDRVSVELDRVIPRVHVGPAVGCEFRVSTKGSDAKYLQHLLVSLEKAESERFRAGAM